MDVLTHAIEAFVSVGANDFSDALAEKAVSLVMKYLPLAYKDGENLLARGKMHNASCMAGLAFNSAGLGLCHGLAHALGAKLHLPHGRANAMLLPYVIEFNADMSNCRSGSFSAAAMKYQRLAKIVELPANNVMIGTDQLRRAVLNLNQMLNIPANLKAMGLVAEGELRDEIADAALKDASTASNPRAPSKQDVLYILDRCLGK